MRASEALSAACRRRTVVPIASLRRSGYFLRQLNVLSIRTKYYITMRPLRLARSHLIEEGNMCQTETEPSRYSDPVDLPVRSLKRSD